MSQAERSSRRQMLIRAVARITTILAIGAALPAGGRPQAAAEPTSLAVPAGVAAPAGGTPPRSTTRAGPYGPTPFPTVPAELQPTPIPRSSVIPTPRPEPTLDPNGPCGMEVSGDLPSVYVLTKSASVIAIGTIKQILPARWSTPDGRRPTEGCVMRRLPPYIIFTPVLIEVEQYIKGEHYLPGDGPQRVLLVSAFGGTLGRDSFEADGDDFYRAREGERILVFLGRPHPQYQNVAGFTGLMLNHTAHYAVTPDGHATGHSDRGYRTIPHQQLLDEIADAQRKPPY